MSKALSVDALISGGCFSNRPSSSQSNERNTPLCGRMLLASCDRQLQRDEPCRLRSVIPEGNDTFQLQQCLCFFIGYEWTGWRARLLTRYDELFLGRAPILIENGFEVDRHLPVLVFRLPRPTTVTTLNLDFRTDLRCRRNTSIHSGRSEVYVVKNYGAYGRGVGTQVQLSFCFKFPCQFSVNNFKVYSRPEMSCSVSSVCRPT